MIVTSQAPQDRFLTRLLHGAEAISAIQFNFVFLLLILYLIGNYQEFSTPSGLLILGLLSFFGFSAIVVNGYSLLIIGVWSFRHHQVAWRKLLISTLRLLLGFVVALTGPILHAFLLPAVNH